MSLNGNNIYLKINEFDKGSKDAFGGYSSGSKTDKGNYWAELEHLRQDRKLEFGMQITDIVVRLKFRYHDVKDFFNDEANYEFVEQNNDQRTFQLQSAFNISKDNRYVECIAVVKKRK